MNLLAFTVSASSDGGGFLGGLLGLVGFAALTVIGVRQAKKRREEFAAAATAHGWTYQDRDDDVLHQWRGDIFSRGHNRQARNIVTGTHDGRGFTAFDYTYYTTETSRGSDGATRTREVPHHHGVLALDVGTAFPALEVSPEGAIGRAFGRLTNSDIQFESEDFNRAFTVTSPDRKFAYDVLHPRMMEFLLGHPQMAWSFHDNHLLTVRGGTFSVADIEQRLTALDAIVDNLPDFVWHNQSEATEGGV